MSVAPLRLAACLLLGLAAAGCDSGGTLPTTCPDTGLVTVADSVIGVGQEASGGFTVDYVGRLASDNTIFDRGQIANRQVIVGFQQGVTGRAATASAPAIAPMRPDGIRRIFIPARFGYGSIPNGPIPACSDLIFEVTLLDP